MADSNLATVLIVNGDAVNRGIWAGYLRPAGGRGWEAETSAKGLELAKQAPKVILLHVSLFDLKFLCARSASGRLFRCANRRRPARRNRRDISPANC